MNDFNINQNFWNKIDDKMKETSRVLSNIFNKFSEILACSPMNVSHVIFVDENLFTSLSKSEIVAYIKELAIGFGKYEVFDIRKYANIISLGGKDSGIKNRMFPNNLYEAINKEKDIKSAVLIFDSSEVGEKYLTKVITDSPLESIVYAKKHMMTDMQAVYLYYLMDDSRVKELD